jgi:hypothetical protein
VDVFLLPSQALVKLYRERLGHAPAVLLEWDGPDVEPVPGEGPQERPETPDFDARVLRDLVQAPMDGQRNLQPLRVAQR